MKGIVRGQVPILGYILEDNEQDPNSVFIQLCGNYDVKGSVPAWIQVFGLKSLLIRLIEHDQEKYLQDIL